MTDNESKTIHERLAIIETKLDTVLAMYVTKEEFKPIKSIVYGMVATILLAFIASVTALVIK